MRKFKLTGIVIGLVFLHSGLSAQNGFNTGINGTVINLSCNKNCITQNFKVPHLKSTSNYAVNKIAYTPFPYVSAAPAVIYPCLANQDDKYFDVTQLPFSFCFYDSLFDKLVVSTNGSVTFDISNALKGANYALAPNVRLPFEGTGLQAAAGSCVQQSADIRLPKAGIFGVFCDIFPQTTDPNYKIEARVEGTAPWRSFVISFSKVPLFGCATSRMTSEIVLHESTGLIDIFIESKPPCNSSNNGLAIVGIQNYAVGTPDKKGLEAPGRGANVQWSATNEAWRFTPSGDVSRFLNCKVYDMAGTLISTGDTITTTAGLLDVTFPNFCQTVTNAQYVIRTSYSSCEDPTKILENADTITVNRTTELNATAAVTPSSCGITGTGTATINVPTGVGNTPYSYILNPGGISQTGNNFFNRLTAGSYSVSVTDAGGCASTVPVVITSNGILDIGFTITNTSCPGATNGSITVNVPNGTPPVGYSINGGAYIPTNVFSGLAPGTYFMSARDNAGCQVIFAQATVAIGTSTLAGTATSTPASCSGASNGTVTVIPAGGSGPYEYSINNGTNWQTASTFNGLAPANYTIIIREAGVCLSNGIPVNVAVGTGAQATATTIPATCNGASDGTITITASNGMAPYQYSLDAGTFQSSNIFTGVLSGPHSFVVKDAGGCITTSTSVTVPAPGFTAAITIKFTSCSGGNDGQVTLVPNNGTAPYRFSLNGGPVQSSGTFSNLTANTYSVIFFDNSGCSSGNIPVTVSAGPTLTGTAISFPTACVGINNGSVKVTPGAAFTGPFQYSLDGGAFQPSDVFTGVSAGNHTVVIRNVAGCTSANIPAVVPAGTTLAGAAIPTAALCNGIANGTIEVTPGNGSGPYLYSLNGGANQPSNIFNGVAAGDHNITITDAFGCISPAIPVTITQPGALATAPPIVQHVKCNGGNDGTITINATGGTTPYTYSLNNINYQSSNIFTVPQGTYTAYVKDANGCSSQLNNIIITQPTALNATVVATSNATCSGGNDGTIQIAATGGSGAYQYSVDGINFQVSNILNVKNGNYVVSIKDANGCTFVISNIIVGVTNNLTLTTTNPAPVCEGSNVQLQAVSNATVYSWSSPTGLLNVAVHDPVVSPAATTTYTVVATLGNCSATADVIVTIMPAPIPNAGINGDICFGQDYQLQGSGGLTYTWTPSTYLSNINSNNPQVIRPDKTITYKLSVIGANGCPSLVTDDVLVNVTAPIKVITSPADTVVAAGAQFQLQAISTGTIYTWTPAAGLSKTDIANPIVTAGASGDVTLYHVSVSTSAGCQGDGYATVKVYKGPDIYVANAFTPNHDGKNDLFIPFPVGIKQLNYFRVFNRWGQMVYSTTTLLQGWDGKAKGIEQPTGVYMWMAEGITENGKKISKKGTVTLIR